MRFFWAITFFSLLPLTAGADALFLKPNKNRPLFQRDSLPLETNRLRTLSNELAILASQPLSKDDPARNRALSQLLALSLQLDPVNQTARQVLQRHDKNLPISPVNKVRYQDSLDSVNEVLTWLLDEQNETNGRTLALLILDPLFILHPQLDVMRDRDLQGEAKRWKGTVPPLTAFRPSIFENSGDAPTLEENVKSAPAKTLEISLEERTITTPLASKVPSGSHLHSLNNIYLEIKRSKDANRVFDLVFEPSLPKPLASELISRVLDVLRKRHGNLPAGYFAKVDAQIVSYSQDNAFALSGPVALLGDAALSNLALRPNLILLAEVNSDGTLVAPNLLWDYLRFNQDLHKLSKTRLLVPSEAEPQIRAFLMTLGSNQSYQLEIFGVDTLEEAMVLATEGKDSESLRESIKLYAEFLEKSLYQDETRFVKSEHGKFLLKKVLELQPNHLCAKTILSQFNTQGPYTLDQSTLYLEYSTCLALLDSLLSEDPNAPKLSRAMILRTKQELSSRLAPLLPVIPAVHQNIYHRFFSVLELLQLSLHESQRNFRSLDNLNTGQNSQGSTNRLRVEYGTLGREIERLKE